jgi:exonuclease III
MARIITYLTILTLNVNGLNSPIKRHQLANWIKKEDPERFQDGG